MVRTAHKPSSPERPSAGARRDHWVAWVATAITCLFLSMPGDSIPPLEEELPWVLPPHADKIVHALLFFLETLFLHRSLRWWPERRPLPWAVAIAAGLALVTEWMQSWIPRRTTDGMDLVANGLGILAFVFVHLMWQQRRRRPTPATEHIDSP